MRGLAVFISDIRNCKNSISLFIHHEIQFSLSGKSREAELRRINKELTNIRQRFRGLKNRFSYSFDYSKHLLLADKTLDGYQKKKYVCKLLFIFLLGHDIDFGYMEAVNLLSSNKYTEKQIVRIEFNHFFAKRFSSIYPGLFIHFCYYEFQFRNEAINYSKYSQ